MWKSGMNQTGRVVLLMVSILIIVSGCASKKSPISGLTDGLTLRYQMPQNRVLKYRLSNGFVQQLGIRGQAVEITSDETRLFSMKSKGRSMNDYDIGVTIDSMAMIMNTPQGVISPDLAGFKGKGFDFRLSSSGREADLPDDEELKYELVPGQKQSIVTGFQALFPDLPPRSVRIGDTWVSRDTIDEKTGRGRLRLVLESKNRLDGFETVDGLKCARVIADVTGILDGEGNEMGIRLKTRAKIKGTDMWYFAYDTGVFVRMVSGGVAEGMINGSGAEEVSIPMRREYNSEIRLIQ